MSFVLISCSDEYIHENKPIVLFGTLKRQVALNLVLVRANF